MKQKDLDTEFEKVEAMGSDDNQTGVSSTKSILKDEQKEDENKKNLEVEFLEKKRRFKKYDYNLSLAKLLLVKLYEDEFPQGVFYHVSPTDIGVYMELTVKGHLFSQAFKSCGIPLYDLNAIDSFVMRTENTVERLCKTTSN